MTMRHPVSWLLSVGILLCAPVLASFLLYDSSFAGETLRIGGTGTSLGSMKLLAKAFGKSHPGIRISVSPSIGSGGGIMAVAKGTLDIGLSSRPLHAKELQWGVSEIEYARTLFVFIVGKNVPIPGLELTELIEIYNGKIQTWPNSEKIRIVLRPDSDTDTGYAKEISPAMSRAVGAALSRRGMLVALTNQENLALIETIPGSLGYSSLTQVLTENPSLKMIAVNGVSPGMRTLADGSYPFSRPLYMVTRGKPTATVQQFIDFVRSPGGARILKRSGNMPEAGSREK